MSDPFEECAAMVRRADPDRYFATLFAPAQHRPLLFALYAFNHELAHIGESVREPMLGEIRLQWWRETLDGAREGRPRAHVVARALAEAFARADLPSAPFDAMIDARGFDFTPGCFPDFAALDAYLDATSGNLMRLAARALGAGNADEVAREAGIAYGLSGVLRSFGFHAARRKLYLPLSIANLVARGPEELFEPDAGIKRRAAINQAALHARDRLRIARRFDVPRDALPAFLPASLAPLYLKTILRSAIDPVYPYTDVSLHRRQMALLAAAARGRF
jgi:phytoene synthase